jgi:hypothetical protein
MRDEIVLALGEHLAGRCTQRNEDVFAEAYEADAEHFLTTVTWAREQADSPIAAIMSEMLRLLEQRKQAAELAERAGRGASEKRVKSILNYARTCLAEMPAADREPDVRHAYKGISDNLVREALLIAQAAADRPADRKLEAYEKGLLVHAYRRQVEQLGEVEAEKWLRLCHPSYAEALLKALKVPT